MCQFFSLVTHPSTQKIMFCNWEDRKLILSGELEIESPDSHSSIAKLHGYKGKAEDKLNKYEYNPLTKVFTVDQINNEIDDSAEVEAYCRRLDFKKIVEPLIIKPIIHPFRDVKPPEVITAEHLELLRQWISVWTSVGNSVRNSVRDSVWASVGNSVGNSVGSSVSSSVWVSVWNSVSSSVWVSVWDSVWTSVGDSVWNSVGNSVGSSVSSSVRAYISSFFDLLEFEKYKCLVTLWEQGLVPSFDGKVWRLYGGKDAKILWEGEV